MKNIIRRFLKAAAEEFDILASLFTSPPTMDQQPDDGM